jgi:hypothetical protein
MGPELMLAMGLLQQSNVSDDVTPPQADSRELVCEAGTSASLIVGSEADRAPPKAGINLIGFIDHGDGAHLRMGPSEAGAPLARSQPLSPATRVFVSGVHPETSQWWYVTAFLPGEIARGYVQDLRVSTDLPDPSSKLHQVRSGDTVEKLAIQEFSSSVRDGHDLRYYENVLLKVNRDKGRDGIAGQYQDPGLFGGGANNIQLIAGHRIWLVSPDYARSQEGAIPDGSFSNGAYAKVKRFAGHLLDLLASVTRAPSYLDEIAGDMAQSIRDHMVEIVGITAAFLAAEAASITAAASPTGVGQVLAFVIQLLLATFGAKGLVDAGAAAIDHGSQWMKLAWAASGDDSGIAAASLEFLRMLVALALAALAFSGVKGNTSKAASLLKITPPGAMPAMALAGVIGPRAAAVEPSAVGTMGWSGPKLAAAGMMSEKKGGEGGSSESHVETSSPNGTSSDGQLRGPAKRHWAASVNQQTFTKEKNTVIESGVDVEADVAAIRGGRAEKVGETYVVNGRTYSAHDGTLYPISGAGLHQLNRGAFKALAVFNKFGDTAEAYAILRRMHNVGPREIDAALVAWRASR